MKTTEVEKKACIDCFHCKTSELSDEESLLCYCAGKRKKVIHQDVYWLKKTVCKKFFNAKDA
jgi:hypothetical protein